MWKQNLFNSQEESVGKLAMDYLHPWRDKSFVGLGHSSTVCSADSKEAPIDEDLLEEDVIWGVEHHQRDSLTSEQHRKEHARNTLETIAMNTASSKTARKSGGQSLLTVQIEAFMSDHKLAGSGQFPSETNGVTAGVSRQQSMALLIPQQNDLRDSKKGTRKLLAQKVPLRDIGPPWERTMDLQARWEGLEDEQEEEDNLDSLRPIPPHEMVARQIARSRATAFSVLEGNGRTLKGRDLGRVRNSVLRRTGFIVD